MEVQLAEAEPWEMLRLPQETEQMKLRKLKILADQEAHAAKAKANIERVLTRRGLGPANFMSEVINREGFTAYLTTNIDEMNKDGLKAVAKAAGVDIKFTNSSNNKRQEKSVEVLRNDIKAYLASHKRVTVASLLEQSSAAGNTVDHTATRVADSDEGGVEETLNDDTVPLCSVLECEFSGAQLCKTCNMRFCNEMHAIHTNGHRLQMLRNGLHFEDQEQGTMLASQTDDANAAESDPTADEGIIDDSSAYKGNSASVRLVVESEQQPRTKKLRLENRPYSSSKPISEVERAAERVFSILRNSRGDKEDELFSALSFESYDITFLNELSALLKVDLSEELNYHRRTTRPKVLKLLIRNLLSKK
jgi:hypothetical protein